MSSHQKSSHELFALLMRRCQENLSADASASGYLRSNGVPNENVWAQFGIGAGSPTLQNEFAGQRAALLDSGLISPRGMNEIDGGVLLPTFNPENMSLPIGFIKLSAAQNKHHFGSKPAGLACSPAINEHSCIIITDTPLLGLRLANAGRTNICIAEDPLAVLPPLGDWLAKHEIILAYYRRSSLEKMRAALGREFAETAKSARIHTELQRTNMEALNLLGITFEASAVPPQLIAKVLKYGKARLAEGQGIGLLRELGVDDAEFIQVYQVGYLPADFFDALDVETKQILKGRIFSDSLIVPTFDANSNPVDLISIRSSRFRNNEMSISGSAVGLIAPKISTAFEDVVIVDEFQAAGRMFKTGIRNVLIIRNAIDAQNNAARLKGNGVKTAQLAFGDAAVTAALQEVGIVAEVTANSNRIASPDIASPAGEQRDFSGKPELINHDPKTETATFAVGNATYRVEVAFDSGSRLQVRLEKNGAGLLDRFDFAVAAQRRRYAMSAAMKTGIPFEQIEQHLVSILDEVAKLQDGLQHPLAKPKATVEISDAERSEALALLKSPELLDDIAMDLSALGWVGEDRPKRLLYLTAISRKLPTPLSAALLSTAGAGKSLSIETIALLTPPEDLIHVSRLTNSALYYQDKDALRHKLLVVDESDALTSEVIVSLRVLQSRGAVSQSHVLRDPVTGATTTQFIEARGPVAVLTSTAGTLEEQVLSRCFDVAIDESTDQTVRILDAQRRLRADPDLAGAMGTRSRIVRRHHVLQRLLVSKPVLIPFAAEIQFPASSIKHRRQQERFLNLIEASALLHQHQRLKQKNYSGEEFIIATIRDFEIATSLASESIARTNDELSPSARDVLSIIHASSLKRFSMNDLRASRPDWTRHKFLTGLNELLRLEFICSPTKGRGKLRYYELLPLPALASDASVRLRGSGNVVELSPCSDNNFNSAAATG